MARVFRNPHNGHKEKVFGDSWVGVLLFGAVYLAAKGLWGHFCLWILVVGLSALLLGLPGLLVVVPLANIAYLFSIQRILANSYLRKGWVEVSGKEPTVVVTAVASERSCPFCAETVKSAAIRCKHCGADLEPVATEVSGPADSGWTVKIPCKPGSRSEVARATLLDNGYSLLELTDLAILVGPEQAWMTTEQFFEAIVHNLEAAMREWAPRESEPARA